MDVTAAVGFLGSLITIASGVKGFFTRLFCGRRYSFPKLTSKNGKVRGILKTFQGNMQSAYGNHIFTPEEISKIQSLVMENSKFVQISEKERKYIKDYIYRAIEACNESIRNSLNQDARILLDSQESNFKDIKKAIKQIADSNDEKKTNGFSDSKAFSFKRTRTKEEILANKRYSECIRNIKNNPSITVEQLSAICCESQRTINQRLATLKKIGVIRRNGPVRGGRWEIAQNNGIFD